MQGGMLSYRDRAVKERETGGADLGAVDIDNIVNMGSTLWTPLYNDNILPGPVDNAFAYAMPEGITNWTQLQSWGYNETLGYSSQWHNGDGDHTFDLNWDVKFLPHGTYHGDGEYLAFVSIEPTYFWAAKNIHVTVNVEAPAEPVNLGSYDDPLAGIEIKMDIWTWYKKQPTGTFYYTWFVQGDGKWEML
ncbi:hypothetical protein KIPB_006761 [Kipferlia bialata]|uniref:Uncharacterized protein n=1 Tax=Kipferlia bialata TaxID=797122 RepID=A0A9K3CXH0_9EUKA|nr:hypothetical protein KIPB_006761 [Kipferlia bialata]|eukprot:g6761.t1